jgi:hypothetical protein
VGGSGDGGLVGQVDAGVGLEVDCAGDDGLAGFVLEQELVVDGGDLEDGVGVGVYADGVGEILSDGVDVRGVLLVFQDDLHVDAEDGLGVCADGDEDGPVEVGHEAERGAFGLDRDRVGGVGVFADSAQFDDAGDVVDVDADLFDVGVGVNVFVYFHFEGGQFLL